MMVPLTMFTFKVMRSSYDLNFDYGYSEPGSLYTEVEAFYVLAEGKTATRIDFDGHIYVNGIYVDTFGMVVYY